MNGSPAISPFPCPPQSNEHCAAGGVAAKRGYGCAEKVVVGRSGLRDGVKLLPAGVYVSLGVVG